ncbi:MAG: hypothetical protein U0Z75_07065 [Deinococcaceae bacterium]
MKAYKGVVRNGVVVFEGRIPEGATVTVTVGDGEFLKATLKSALGRTQKSKWVPLKPVTLQRNSQTLASEDPEPLF